MYNINLNTTQDVSVRIHLQIRTSIRVLRRKVEKRAELKEIETLSEMDLREREEEVVRYYLERERGGGEERVVLYLARELEGEREKQGKKERKVFRSDDGEERRRERGEGDSSL